MIHYLLYQKNPASHYIYIDLTIDNISDSKTQLQLPAWRPGRYELGNFAKNIKRVDAFNEKGEALPYTKLNKDLWEIDTRKCSKLKVTYSYYSAEMTAGSCFADTSQMYVNPVHCCMYVPNRMQEEHILELKIPENYSIATSLKKNGNQLTAVDLEELLDSPFIASATLQSEKYRVNNIDFYLHFNGECRPDFKKIHAHFQSFTQHMIAFWGDFPYNEYHFLFQVLPTKFYHGVEHKKNTVIALGPGYTLNEGATYEDLLGVSCHELFHVWNVKTIRPAEMMPYNYTKENYARSGYVYEGFTTYYGDKLLLSSKVFNLQEYFDTLNIRLHKHFHNFGRYNLSVADSSWETWLDGYVPGAPYRKTNIYDEGNLIAFMLDVKILEATALQKSLRDVCVHLYERFGKKQNGYAESDILNLVNEVSGEDFSEFFKTYVYSANDFEIPLKECFQFLGITFTKENNPLISESAFGFKTMENNAFSKVTLVAPYSQAWKAGLFAGDEIMAVNGMVLKNNLNHWLNYFKDKEAIELLVNSNEQIKTLVLEKDKKGNTWFFIPKLTVAEEQTTETKNAFASWMKW